MRRQGRHRYPGRSGRHTGRVRGDNHQRRLVDQGKVDLAAPVQTYLPGFAGKGKDRVTVAMLLAHTGGLPVGAKGTGLPNDAARREAVLTTPLVSGATPGDVFRYSSTGLMVLGQLVEKLTGKTLDQRSTTAPTTAHASCPRPW